MRKSPLKKTPEKSRTISKSRFVESTPVLRTTSNLYYCHYRNAMYMGGIKSFKKEGRGILLHDCGLSVLTSYYNDVMHGHNIFIDNYNLLSAIYNKSKIVEAVYRTQGFLVYLQYNQDQELEGNIKLLNFITKSIVYAAFRKGAMTNKEQETDTHLLNRVFELGQIQIIIGRIHTKAITYDFQKMENIECQKHGNKVVVGFEKNGFLNGLGFQFIFRGSHGGYNPDTHRQEDDFELRVVERGYYMNTQLNGMGEKVFKNGNFYIGQFKNGVFEGNGILKNSQKKNWVSGYFKGGNLVELIEYSSEGSAKNINKIVEAMHERKTNWINYEVTLIGLNFFVDEIEKIITTVPNKQVLTLEQRKLEVLRKIQEKFITQTNETLGPDELQSSITRLKNNSAQSPSKFLHSFAPEEPEKTKPNLRIVPPPFEENSSGKLQKRVLPAKTTNASQPQNGTHTEHSPGLIRVHDNVLSSSRQRAPMQTRLQSGSKRTVARRIQFGQSRLSRGAYNLSQSTDRLSSNNNSQLDSKRMIAKNKIFKYLQNQQQKGSPQFSYTKVDTLRELRRQR